MSKTVKQQGEEANQIVQHVRDANALVERLRTELCNARTTIEWMVGFAPEEFERRPGYYLSKDNNAMTAARGADLQIAKINGLLGDRA